MRRRPVRSLQIPLGSRICPTDFTDIHRFLWEVLVTQIFYSSDDTEFIRRFLATAITHGFTQRRPVRSIQIPPESGICPTESDMSHRFHSFLWEFFCPTDFTDLHRFFVEVFVTQISQMTQIFFIGDFYSSDDTEFIRRFLATAITHGFSRMRPVRSLQIPPEIGLSDSPEIP